MSYYGLLDAYYSKGHVEDYEYISGEHKDVVKSIIKASKDNTNITFNGFISDSTVELLKDCGFSVFINIYNDTTQIYWNS